MSTLDLINLCNATCVATLILTFAVFGRSR